MHIQAAGALYKLNNHYVHCCAVDGRVLCTTVLVTHDCTLMVAI
jgi:hypothetical protein